MPAEVSIRVTVKAHLLTTTDVLAASLCRAHILGVVLAALGNFTLLALGILLFNHNHLLGHSIVHHDLIGLDLALECSAIDDEMSISLLDLWAHGNTLA